MMINNKPNILFLDIETAPALSYVWKIFKETIPLARLLESGYLLCWAGKWKGGKSFCYSLRDNPQNMISLAHQYLDAADIIVHYNGSRFDIPTLNREMAREGLTPPAPYKQVDLYKIVKSRFKLESYKMEYVLKYFGLTEKLDNGGFETWLGAIEGDDKAWDRLIRYNKRDISCTEQLYNFLLPWISNHPNMGLYTDRDVSVCTNCGSTSLQKRGAAVTKTLKYQRFCCTKCGAWMRGKASILTQEKSKTILTQVV